MTSNSVKVYGTAAGSSFPKKKGATTKKHMITVPPRCSNSDSTMIAPKQVFTTKYLRFLIESEQIKPNSMIIFNISCWSEVKSQLNSDSSQEIGNQEVPQNIQGLTPCTLINSDDSLPVKKYKDDIFQETLSSRPCPVKFEESNNSLKSLNSYPLKMDDKSLNDRETNSSQDSRPLFTSYTIEFDKCEDRNTSQQANKSAKPCYIRTLFPLKVDEGNDNDFSQKTRPILISKSSQIKEHAVSKSAPKFAQPRPLPSSLQLVDEIEHKENKSYVELHVQKSKGTLMKVYNSLEMYNPNKLTTLYVHKSAPRKIKAYHNSSQDKNGYDTYTILNAKNSAHCEMTRYTTSSSFHKSEVLYVNKALPTKMKVNNPGSQVYTAFYVNEEAPLKMEVPGNWDKSQNIYLRATMLHDDNYYEYLPAIGSHLKVRIKLKPDEQKK